MKRIVLLSSKNRMCNF